MSATAAIFSLNREPISSTERQPIRSRLARYGSQRQWDWQSGPIAIDGAHDEYQPPEATLSPAVSPSGRWTIAGPLRLDGRQALASALDLDPTVAKGLGDGELAARAFDRWQEAALRHIIGSFALIVWDRLQQSVLAASDPAGESRLYFYRGSQRLVLATNATVVLAHPHTPRQVDSVELLRYFTDQRDSRRTPLTQIEHLPPAHCLCCRSDGRFDLRRYWEPPPPLAWKSAALRDAPEAIRETLREAVADRIKRAGPRPSGFCSGGLDSASVSALAAQILADRGQTFHTYTSIPHPAWNEASGRANWDDSEEAQVLDLARRHDNIEATFVAVDGTIFLDCLPHLFETTAGPVRNTGNMPWFFALWATMQADGSRLYTTGGRGNGTFSFDHPPQLECWRARRLDLVWADLRAAPAATARFAASWIRAQAQLAKSRKASAGAEEASWTARIALNASAARAHGLRDYAHSTPHPLLGLHQAHTAFHRMYERTPMRPSERLDANLPLQSCDPTSDPRLIELCGLCAPTEFRLGGQRRRLARRAMKGILPDSIRLRSRRGAQAPDEPLHIRARFDDLRDALEFVGQDAFCSAMLDMKRLRQRLAQWRADPSACTASSLIDFSRSISFGLYYRWITDDLHELPGARPLAEPIVRRARARE